MVACALTGNISDEATTPLGNILREAMRHWPTSVSTRGGKWAGDPRVMGSAVDCPRAVVHDRRERVVTGRWPTTRAANGFTGQFWELGVM
jgi:hypothetical protein